MGALKSSSQGNKRQSRVAAAVEFLIVAGASLLFIFWIAPTYIVSGTNLGLSPAMLPTACAAVILAIAAFQFLRAIIQPSSDTPATGNAVLVIALILVTIAAALTISYAGLVPAGALMTGGATVLLGERRITRILAMAAGGAAVMYLVVWSGL